MKTLITYATISGMTLLVAEAIHEYLQEKNIDSELKDMADLKPQDLHAYDLVIMGSSTYNDGKYNDVSQDFFTHLNEAEDIDLSKTKIALFGLGDRFYSQFCTVVDLMKEEIEAKKGNVYQKMIRIDGFPEEDTFEEVRAWTKEVLDNSK